MLNDQLNIEKLKNVNLGFDFSDIAKLKALMKYLLAEDETINVTLSEFSNEYILYVQQNHSNSYYRSCKIALKHFNNYFPQRVRIKDLTLPDLEKFVTHLQTIVKRGWRVYLKNYKAMFSRAVLLGYVKENLFNRIKVKRSQELKVATVTAEQLQLIKKHIKNKNVGDIVSLAFLTGLRISEAIFLSWHCVNINDRTITIGSEAFTTKTRRQRIIPMTDEVHSLLVSRLPKIYSPDGYVFAKKDDQHFTTNYISHRFKRAARKAGMSEQITFHSLRHSCASNLIQKGCSIYLVKELLGHQSVTTTEIYSHSNIEALRNEMNKAINSANPNTIARVS